LSLIKNKNKTDNKTMTTMMTVSIKFRDFVPMYRGKEVLPTEPMYKPLQSDSIYEMSLMCRSAFGDQKGDFGLVILGIDGWVRTDIVKDQVKETKQGEGWWGWLRGMFGWVWGWAWFGGEEEEGRVRLDEKEL